jgi:hypothetical protein
MGRLAQTLTLLAALSCGRQAEVSPELAPLWQEFGERVAYAGAVQGKFVDELPEDAVGLCYTRKLADQTLVAEVSLLRSAWDSYGPGLRKTLVFHELGHCVLGLEHDEAVGEAGPESIMFPSVFDMQEREDELVERLER